MYEVPYYVSTTSLVSEPPPRKGKRLPYTYSEPGGGFGGCCCCGCSLQTGTVLVAYVSIMESAGAFVAAFAIYTNTYFAMIHAVAAVIGICCSIGLLIGANEGYRPPVLIWLLFGVTVVFSSFCLGGYWLHTRLLLHGADFGMLDLGIIVCGLHLLFGMYFWAKVYQFQERLREDRLKQSLLYNCSAFQSSPSQGIIADIRSRRSNNDLRSVRLEGVVEESEEDEVISVKSDKSASIKSLDKM